MFYTMVQKIHTSSPLCGFTLLVKPREMLIGSGGSWQVRAQNHRKLHSEGLVHFAYQKSPQLFKAAHENQMNRIKKSVTLGPSSFVNFGGLGQLLFWPENEPCQTCGGLAWRASACATPAEPKT
jgi:hypothetical protein